MEIIPISGSVPFHWRRLQSDASSSFVKSNDMPLTLEQRYSRALALASPIFSDPSIGNMMTRIYNTGNVTGIIPSTRTLISVRVLE